MSDKKFAAKVKQKKEGLSEFVLLGPELNYAYVTVKEKDIAKHIARILAFAFLLGIIILSLPI